MQRIILAGKDWTSRALLRAQLIEEGFDIEAYEDAEAADNRLSKSRDLPQLLIADLFESDNLPEDIATLSH
jgi:CheY-like chemotaxis protein